jgi:RNA polymerase sigma-70 factor (ECF subfamily)
MIYTNSRDDFEAEFALLLKEHEHNLRVFAYRVTKCEQLAKDVVQEVFLKLWEHRDQFHQIENIKAWLYRVTENKLIDHLRKWPQISVYATKHVTASGSPAMKRK